MISSEPSAFVHDCSQISLARGELLAGTASRVDTWFLLSYDRPMGQKAFPQSDIPQDVKDHLDKILDSTPRSKLLLVKPRSSQTIPRIGFEIVLGRETEPCYYSLHLDRYEDLLDLDIGAILKEEQAYLEYRSQEPFYLVCTNGKRDPCCARYGMEVFQALEDLEPGRARRCSHVGSHRFAANVLAFPHGIYYGRFRPPDAAALLTSGEKRQILIDHYRGRACYDPPVQAAEDYLHRETGILDLDAFRFMDSEPRGDNRWWVRFTDATDGGIHRLEIERSYSAELDFVSCRSDKQEPVTSYRVLPAST